MKIEELLSKVASERGDLANTDYGKVCVSSTADNTSGSGVFDSFRSEIKKRAVKAVTVKTGPAGYHDLEPFVIIEKPGKGRVFYHNVAPEMVPGLVDDVLVHDGVNRQNVLCTAGEAKSEGVPDVSEVPLFNLQNRVALRNCGYIDPDDINDCLLRGQGFTGLSRALQMDRRDIIGEMEKAGLRNNGTGVLIAEKWKACLESGGRDSQVICNAMDVAPGANTARLLLESDPYSVIEGTLIAAYAAGAGRGVICVAAGNSTAIDRLKKALDLMREYSLAGPAVLDSTFGCEIEIKPIDPCLILVESDALRHAIEIDEKESSERCVYPGPGQLKGGQAVVDDAETMSRVAAMFQNGHERHADNGTRVITLSGSIVHPYTVEVPPGTTLANMVIDIGGGVPGGGDILAVQFGGPTGTLFTPDSLHAPIGYDAMVNIHSGSVEVFDGDSCIVERTREIASYIKSQLCGKCLFCREGTHQMSVIIKDITEMEGETNDLDLLRELGEALKTSCLCSLGRAAPVPVMSSIELFRDAFEAHLKGKCLKAGG